MPAWKLRPNPFPTSTLAVDQARAGGLKRFVARIVDALLRYGEGSYEAKRGSGRLNHYFY